MLFDRNSVASKVFIAVGAAIFLGLLILTVHFTGLFTKSKGLPETKQPAGYVVCLDPGHPTEFNSGLHYVRGLREVDINWQVALKIRKLLEQRGVKVVLTKESVEQLVSNPQRSVVANNAGADLMVRLHCDAGPSQGFTLYYPDRQAHDLKTYGPVRAIRVASRYAAYRIHSGMLQNLQEMLKDRGVRGESRTKVGEYKGALRGSIYVKVPVVTIEMVFLTDYYDSEFIRGEWGQNMMAKAIADGIMLSLEEPNTHLTKPD